MAAFSYLVPMTEADLDWVMEIEQSAYLYPWTPNGFIQVLDRGLGYVLCDDECQPCGYACLLPVVDELELLNFCVAPSHQGCGVAKSAMAELLALFAESDYYRMLLEVRVSNTAAIRVYEANGFERDGIRPNYYRNGDVREDALLMSKIL